MNDRHVPVLKDTVLDVFNPSKGKIYLDATLGDAGHTQVLLEKGATVVAFEQDPQAIDRALAFLKLALPKLDRKVIDAPLALPLPQLLIIRANFSHLSDYLTPLKLKLKLNGALFDLGVSSFQLTDPHKGLTFNSDSPLDMRLDPVLGVTAADLLKILSEKELKKLFWEFGGETFAAPIAKKIVQTRAHQPLTTTKQLADLIVKIKPRLRIHPATQVFQALRIAVNTELDNLRLALLETPKFLKPNAPLAVITFHSGEDQIVKEFLQGSVFTSLTLHYPTDAEINNNPRSRSARLRAAYLK